MLYIQDIKKTRLECEKESEKEKQKQREEEKTRINARPKAIKNGAAITDAGTHTHTREIERARAISTPVPFRHNRSTKGRLSARIFSALTLELVF